MSPADVPGWDTARTPIDPVPTASWPYRSAAWVAFAVMRLQRWRFDVHGLEHVPRSGGAVIAANHSSFWDYFTVGRAPYLRRGRPVRILAKASLFDDARASYPDGTPAGAWWVPARLGGGAPTPAEGEAILARRIREGWASRRAAS